MSKEVIIYKNTDGSIALSVFIENETVWLTIDQMAELFNKSRSTINEHILNIYNEKELTEEEATELLKTLEFTVTYNKMKKEQIHSLVDEEISKLKG